MRLDLFLEGDVSCVCVGLDGIHGERHWRSLTTTQDEKLCSKVFGARGESQQQQSGVYGCYIDAKAVPEWRKGRIFHFIFQWRNFVVTPRNCGWAQQQHQVSYASGITVVERAT